MVVASGSWDPVTCHYFLVFKNRPYGLHKNHATLLLSTQAIFMPPRASPLDINIDAIYKAIANPVRREILARLREPQVNFAEQQLPLDYGVCAGQIYACCTLSQSTTSAHLASLQRAGLVTSKRVGQWVFFKRNESVIRTFLAHVNIEL